MSLRYNIALVAALATEGLLFQRVIVAKARNSGAKVCVRVGKFGVAPRGHKKCQLAVQL
jgi:hypothetical protein